MLAEVDTSSYVLSISSVFIGSSLATGERWSISIDCNEEAEAGLLVQLNEVMHGPNLAECLALWKGSTNTERPWALSCIGPVSLCVIVQVDKGARSTRTFRSMGPLAPPTDSEIWSMPQGPRSHGSLQQPLAQIKSHDNLCPSHDLTQAQQPSLSVQSSLLLCHQVLS